MGDISIDDATKDFKLIDDVMPSVKPPASNSNRICNTCNKEDVCMYKSELAQAAKEITQILERKNVFIDTDIRCKKWSGKVSNYRGLAENQKNSMLMFLNKMQSDEGNS